MRRLLTILPALVLVAAAAAAQEPVEEPRPPLRTHPPLEVEPPVVRLRGLDAVIKVTASEVPEGGLDLELRDATGSLVRIRDAAGHLADGRRLTDTDTVTLRFPVGDGALEHELWAPAQYRDPVSFSLPPRTIPGWLAIVPPALAILLALLLRQVIPALGAGVWVGAWIAFGGGWVGFLQTLDRYLMGELLNRDHLYILVFSMLLGGMVGIISRSGGTAGLVEVLSRQATDTRRGQFFTWIMGLVIFFDDYANTLVVGNTMRPVTDRLRISREKLAYIVDSTAAPVASLALVSTWIGFEVSLIADALIDVGSTEDAYWVFLQAIPYAFYPILALAMVLLIAVTGRDFGPMLHAERRAAGGQLLASGAAPLSNFDHGDLQPEEGMPRRWINATIPVGIVLVVVFASQYLMGKASLEEAGDPLAQVGLFRLGLKGFGTVFAAGDSFQALLYGATCGCLAALLLAWAQRLVSIADGIKAWVEGMKTMFLAFIILSLAWAIGAVCRDLGTADYIVSLLAGSLHPGLLPLLIFIFSAVIAFSTGSSWSTMSILVPLAVPSAFGVATAAGWDAASVHQVLLGSVASVLAGAIFGDHCSPISDTTVLSSMASACDHVDHVRTQLPYALLAAAVAMVVGSVPAGFGLSPWISIPVGLGVVAVAVRWLGRPVAAS